jgi:hypothetical protein
LLNLPAMSARWLILWSFVLVDSPARGTMVSNG